MKFASTIALHLNEGKKNCKTRRLIFVFFGGKEGKKGDKISEKKRWHNK